LVQEIDKRWAWNIENIINYVLKQLLIPKYQLAIEIPSIFKKSFKET